MLTSRRKNKTIPSENGSCLDILHTLFLRCLWSSSTSDECATTLLSHLHPSLLKSFYEAETRDMGLLPMPPSQWPIMFHKLFVFHVTYKVAAMPGNEGFWKSLRDPHDRMMRVKEMIRQCAQKTPTNFCALMPRCNTIDIDRLHISALRCLRHVDWYATNAKEERNLDILGTILERFVSNEFPLDVLLLLEGEEWEDRFVVWKQLCDARNRNHIGEWTRVVSQLSDPFKRYIKFFLLSLMRHEQFSATYVLPTDPSRTKCTKNVSSTTMVTFCNFCKECLTYVDMGRRPPSFGHYLNVDTMKQFCHRDDSDRLHLISCMNDDPYVNIEFGHPDREHFGVCQGRRGCYELVGYQDKLCAFCFHDPLDIHARTCLAPDQEEDGEPCSGCRHILSKDPTIKQRLIVLKEEEMRRQEEEQMKLEEQITKDKDEKWKTKKRKLFYLMDQAMKRKQRSKLIR